MLSILRGVNLVMYMSISNVYVWKDYKQRSVLNGSRTGEFHDQGDNDEK
jgi:hypothetical protein